ncbi:MAG: HAD family phosphatase [Clostridia bacterium]|nr:HAD family phosphatase [Clostridia bacterium]
MIKAMIFDMDGTILDSMSYWRRINVDFLKERGLEPPEEIRADILSISNRVCADMYAAKYDLNMTRDEILAEYRRIMSRYYATEITPKPRVGEYMDHLLASGVRLCLGTATPRELAQPALSRHGLWDKFEFIVSGLDLGLDKQYPEYYRYAVDKLGLDCGECAMFEDALYAMKGAKEAGLVVYGIYDPIHEKYQKEIEEICDVYIHGYAELLDENRSRV